MKDKCTEIVGQALRATVLIQRGGDCFGFLPVKGSTREVETIDSMIFSECGGGGGGVVEGDGRVEGFAREFVGRLEVWRGW